MKFLKSPRFLLVLLLIALGAVSALTLAAGNVLMREAASLNTASAFLVACLIFVLPLFIFAGYRYHRVTSAEMSQREAQYRALVDQSMVGVFTTTLDGRFTFANDAMARMYDFETVEQLLLEGSLSRWTDLKQRDRMLTALQQHGSVTNFETESPSYTGRLLHVLFSATLEGDRILGMVMDITERKKTELLLEKSEAHLRRAQEVANSGSWELDVPGGRLYWSDEVYRMFGMTHEEELTYDAFLDTVAPEDREYLERSWQAALEGEPYDIEHRILVGGEVRWLREKAQVEFDEEGQAIRGIGIVQDISEHKLSEQKVREYQQRLKSLASQLTLAEDRERRSIAADLHDHIGGALTLTRLHLARLLRRLPAGDPLIPQLEEISQTMLRAIQDTRHLIFHLSTPTLDELGMGPAIEEWMKHMVEENHELHFQVIDNAQRAQLDDDLRAILFRSVRELLTNVVKHAQAKSVSVRLEKDGARFKVTVQDDGVGFDPQTISSDLVEEGGFGLFSIQERVQSVGGELGIVSRPGEGCRVFLWAPIEAMHSSNSA